MIARHLAMIARHLGVVVRRIPGRLVLTAVDRIVRRQQNRPMAVSNLR